MKKKNLLIGIVVFALGIGVGYFAIDFLANDKKDTEKSVEKEEKEEETIKYERDSEIENKLVEIRDELAEINDSEDIDMNITTEGEYAKIEKLMKDYFKDIMDSFNIINENDYKAIFSKITYRYLRDHADDLPNFLKNIDKQYELANGSLEKYINLLEEDYIIELFEDYDINEVYFDFYKELMILETDEEIKQELIDYKKENDEKTEYVRNIVKLLNNNQDEWYVDNTQLLFYDETLLKEFNNLYILLQK